jgi:hypothetical protein
MSLNGVFISALLLICAYFLVGFLVGAIAVLFDPVLLLPEDGRGSI